MCRRFLLTGLMVAIVLRVAQPAMAAQFQVGLEAVSLSASKENDATVTAMPTLAVGAELPNDAAIWGEAGVLSYSVDKSGDRANQVLSQGSIDVTGFSLAAIYTKALGSVGFRLGLGIIQYQFKNSFSSGTQQELLALGVTNAQETISNETGTQYLAGLDIPISRQFQVGVEYRNVTVKPKTQVSLTALGRNFTGNDTADLSHTWIGLRLAWQF